LIAKFGSGYTEKGLRRMIQFAERFPDVEIVATLSRHSSWSRSDEILPVKETV
jgi:hypothetical protein